jgi:hypothetical protein
MASACKINSSGEMLIFGHSITERFLNTVNQSYSRA